MEKTISLSYETSTKNLLSKYFQQKVTREDGDLYNSWVKMFEGFIITIRWYVGPPVVSPATY